MSEQPETPAEEVEHTQADADADGAAAEHDALEAEAAEAGDENE